jgi:hypothetical protein
MTDNFIIRRKINQLEKHIEWMQKHLGESDALRKRLSEISRLRAELVHNSCSNLVKSYNE